MLSIALLLTLLAFYYVSQNVEAEARTRFDENTLAAKTVIYRRVNRYLDAMFGARGLFAGGGPVGREEWSGYVRALEPERRFRLNGFQSLSFAKYLGPGEKVAYLRKEGLRDLWPEPEGERTAYFPLTFVSPSSVANRRMISYDAYSDPVHRSVIERARDTGLPQATRMDYVLTEAPLDSGKEVVWRKGIVVYLPVYEEN